MRALTVSAFRKHLKRHLDAVVEDQEIIVIPRDNGDGDGEGVVVMPLSHYSRYSETDRINASPVNRERLLAAKDRLDRGEGVTMEPSDYDDRVGSRGARRF